MKINVDFSKVLGKIKPLHGVGQPPFIGPNFSMFKYLKDAGIPYSRLHDVGGMYGGFRWVDIPNIFRDFDADVNEENSYDFTFTDLMITALIENGVEPFFRLGVTIENDAPIKAYRIFPPKDYKKWALICEHIIRHYTEGWANGFNYKITYWEIWNEPDNFEDIYENRMWRGTKEQYYELYAVASKHLKTCFPHLKIGGYASCGFYDIKKSYIEGANSSPRFEYFIEFFDGFMEYIKKENCPLDFFSWHSYDGIENNVAYANYARKRLDEYGFLDTETMCNEWLVSPRREMRGTYKHASLIAGMMLAWQNTALDSAMIYDARLGPSVYGSLFNCITNEPYPAYYSFVSFNKLYSLQNQVEVQYNEKGVYALGAKKGKIGCLVVANTTDKEMELEINADAEMTKVYDLTQGKEYPINLTIELSTHGVLIIEYNI